MSALMANESVDFKTLKALLDVTDGNMASHMKALEKEDYVAVSKSFIGRKPHTSYQVTISGRKAFQAHIDALENLIKAQAQNS